MSNVDNSTQKLPTKVVFRYINVSYLFNKVDSINLKWNEIEEMILDWKYVFDDMEID